MIEKYNFQKQTYGNKFLIGKTFIFDIIPCTIPKLLQYDSTIIEMMTR